MIKTIVINCAIICLSPLIITFLLASRIQEECPKIFEYYCYKWNNKKYVKYQDMPYLAKLEIDLSNYKSYKDKIAIIENDNMKFAEKYIVKKTNKMVYVANDKAIDVNIEIYKIHKTNKVNNN